MLEERWREETTSFGIRGFDGMNKGGVAQISTEVIVYGRPFHNLAEGG